MSQQIIICRICLASDVRMYKIGGSPLQMVFERISNTPLYTGDSRSVVACFVCYAHLKRSYKLMLTSIQAENMLTSILRNNLKGANELQDYKLNSLSGLCVSSVDCIDTFSFNAPIMVKNEPECLQDTFKQEIDYEESFDSQQVLDLVSAVDNEKCEVDLKDDEVLRSIQMEQEYYTYRVKVEPMENDNWQGAATVAKSEITEERQLENRGLKKKKKHSSSRHKIKREHKRKHIKKDITSVQISGSEKQIQSDNKLSKNSKCQSYSKSRTTGRYFECNDCQSRFSRKCHLETHMIVHSGEKPFQCTVCRKRFNMKHSLDRHLKRHTGEKSFACPVCERRFIENSVLKIHLRTHTGEKPYQCDICEKRFKQRNDLKRHRRTHTGEKPFKCDICQRSFNERSKVTRHQKKHYGEKLTNRDLKKLFM